MSTYANRTSGTTLTVLMKNTAAADVAAGEVVKMHATQNGNIMEFDSDPESDDTLLGITMKAIKVGEVGEIVVLGSTPATAGATISAGAAVTAGTTGSVVTAASGDVVLGYALNGGDAADAVDVFVMLPSMGDTA